MIYKNIIVNYRTSLTELTHWAKTHILGLFIFNTTVILLTLLNTAQYFKPFYYLGINEIFFISMIMSIFLLGARSRTMFLLSMLFLTFSMFLKVVKVDVWSDRGRVSIFINLYMV
jgi:hypothetical protein